MFSAPSLFALRAIDIQGKNSGAPRERQSFFFGIGSATRRQRVEADPTSASRTSIIDAPQVGTRIGTIPTCARFHSDIQWLTHLPVVIEISFP